MSQTPVKERDLSLSLWVELETEMMTNLFSARSLFSVLVLLCAINSAAATTFLPDDEVNALKEIAATLRKTDWDFNADPCSTIGTWGDVKVPYQTKNALTCDCTFTDANDNTVCHVISIVLKEQSLPGTLPPQLFKLPYLQNFDVTRNYLNSSIPKEWGSTNLRNISLLGNRLTGPIPKELGNISTLSRLVVEINQLSGPLPPHLGNLSRLLALHLTSNTFTGELPPTFAKLTTLQELRLSDNQFTGKIPNFIQNLTNLEMLVIQGSGLQGPIPSGIALLEKLLDLRISDLDGPESRVPQLSSTNIQTLILRSCNLVGELPDYLAGMTNLKTLDLSANRLTGHVPDTMGDSLDYIFLTNNFLTGAIPSWVTSSNKFLDLSYNNFNGSPPTSCQLSQVNLVSSYSSYQNNSLWCLEKYLPCSGKAQYDSLFINCGGTQMSYERNHYEEDTNPNGPSYFSSFSSSSSEKWAYSSTGLYMGNDDADYTANNPFSMNVSGSGFYQTARLSPWSIRYYGLCMKKGSYKVRLHFAEIQYSDNETFSSLGRRIFDVSIQGNQVLEDFNIAEEAGGVGQGIYRDFDNIYVHGSTLEIHLYWSGKGTTAIPDRGTNGPLISAIAVTPNFDAGSTWTNSWRNRWNRGSFNGSPCIDVTSPLANRILRQQRS